MEGSHYPSNGIIGTSAGQTYPSPTAISPQQLQSGLPLPQTLPPLQPPASAMQPLYGSHPHTPRTPGTPNTPTSNTNGTAQSNGPSSNPPNYQQHQTSQPGARGPYAMTGNPYAPHQGYPTSGAMMPQTTTAASHPQPIAPAPAGNPAGNRGPPVLRPMPPTGMPTGMAPLPHAPPGHMLPTAEWKNPGWMGANEGPGEAPTHVVGSQGRRGILPSAPGRPAAPAAGSGAGKSTAIPVKDADGKFACPHCVKTYLHAKHLKRHLLRHTGERPYMCVLCRDTFSRSDILKRHFQKCSIRRGNPTGASHLSHPMAHVKRNNNGQAHKQAGQGNEGDLNHVNGGMSNMPPGDGMVHPFGMVPVNDGMNNMPGDQNQLSRSSSMGNGNASDRRHMPGQPMGASQPYPSDVSNSMSNQQMTYSMPPGQNGLSMFGGSNPSQQSGLDWTQIYHHPGAQQSSSSTSFPPNLGQTQIATKTEPKTEPFRPTDESTREPPTYSKWGVPSDIQNPYTVLSHQILNFLYPSNQALDPHLTGMHLHFSPDNMKDFVDKYTHFHVHTPLLHLPTFRIMDVGNGLLAIMCCIGACYSDRIGSSHVRDMMDSTWSAFHRESRMMNSTLSASQAMAASQNDIEELQAFVLMIIVHLWNGTPQQRERARQMFPLLVSRARQFGLLQVAGGSHRFNPMQWESWVDKERRIRLMYGIYLGDTAMGLYFNIPAQIDAFELRNPLPCDDAAWEAESPWRCAEALGHHGPEDAYKTNPYGTRRAQQPEVDQALKALLDNSQEIQPGSTNLYGKFVLIHALIAIIQQAQREGRLTPVKASKSPLTGDWLQSWNPNNGSATPVKGVSENIDAQSLTALSFALEKFKANWDVDMENQFPPVSLGANNPQRHGFSRDGVHFFWLAKYLLKFTTSEELQLEPDARFVQVIQYLKGVRMWVMNDGLARGEELGSIGEIDDQFGYADLTLDMAQLFKPLPHVVEDAGTTSVKTELGST